jgi:hypothetical protein
LGLEDEAVTLARWSENGRVVWTDELVEDGGGRTSAA